MVFVMTGLAQQHGTLRKYLCFLRGKPEEHDVFKRAEAKFIRKVNDAGESSVIAMRQIAKAAMQESITKECRIALVAL